MSDQQTVFVAKDDQPYFNYSGTPFGTNFAFIGYDVVHAPVPAPPATFRGGGGGGGGGGGWLPVEITEDGDGVIISPQKVIETEEKKPLPGLMGVPREALEREVLSLRRRVKDLERQQAMRWKRRKAPSGPDPEAVREAARKLIEAIVLETVLEMPPPDAALGEVPPRRNDAVERLLLAGLIAAGTYFVIPDGLPELKMLGYVLAGTMLTGKGKV